MTTTLQTYESPVFLNKGTRADIYRISDDKIAKFNRKGMGDIESEVKVAFMLHEEGFPVPISYGIHPIGFEYAHVMEFVEGEELGKLGGDINTGKVLRKVQKIVDKAEKKGFATYDALHERNILVSRSGIITLIDFGGWSHRDLI